MATMRRASRSSTRGAMRAARELFCVVAHELLNETYSILGTLTVAVAQAIVYVGRLKACADDSVLRRHRE